MENQHLKYNSNNLRDELYLRTGRGVKNVKLSEMKRYYKKDDFLYDMLGQQMLNLGLTIENVGNQEFWNQNFEEAVNNSYGLYLQYKKEDEYRTSEQRNADVRIRMEEYTDESFFKRSLIHFEYTRASGNTSMYYVCPCCYDFYVTKPAYHFGGCLSGQLKNRQLTWVLQNKRLKEQMGKESEDLFKKILNPLSTGDADDADDSSVERHDHSDDSVDVYVEDPEEEQQPKRQRVV
jgi:hypothetical protein